jgi:UPF0755 protein
MLKKLFLFLLLAIIIAVAAAWYLFDYHERELFAPLPVEETVVVNVNQGTSFQQLMRRFEADGWLKHADFMRLYSRLHPELTSIRAGEYAINPGSSLMDVIDKMNRGDVIAHRFTIIEGHTFRQMISALHADERIQPTLKDKSEAELMEIITGDPDLPAEGMFLAETYQFIRGATDVDILRRANRDLQSFLEAQWMSRDESLPYKSPYEAVIMASIIERETGVAAERSKIAGVFVRRLNIGMRLQTDPTVIYGMGDSYVGRITRADLQRPTPWNTYTIDGLPPTPISMVGREAIVAAFNPLEGNALYFVARGDGTHHFSATLREHNNAVNRYQRNRRSDYRSSPPPAGNTP